jgi:fluoroacetyl-CoA thioesterase
MISASAIGREERITALVGETQSADAYGNSGLQALASPALVGLIEVACMKALEGLLETGERSVGSVVEIEHRAPTPVGARVEVEARLTQVDGQKVWFSVLASDHSGLIAEGRHARFVVDDQRFQSRLKKMTAALPARDD